MELTFASEDDRDIPQLSHVVRLEDLSLIRSTITIQSQRAVILAHVHIRKANTSTNRDLRTDDTVTTVKAGREHVHRTALAVRNTLAATEQLADDGTDAAAAHVCEAVAAVGGDEVVCLFDGVFDADCDGFLTGGEMAETSDFLFLVQAVGGHFHSSVDCLWSARGSSPQHQVSPTRVTHLTATMS